MEISSMLRQFLVFIHLFAFAFSIAAVIRHDLLLLKDKEINFSKLHSAANKLIGLLGVLWLTGALLIYMSVGSDLQLLLNNPKLMAKITVVLLLTVNGVFLHRIAFPMMSGKINFNASLCSVLGAISTTSWIFAGLIGACRVLGPLLSYEQFMAVYGLALTVSLLIALTVVKEMLNLRNNNWNKLRLQTPLSRAY